MHEVTFRRVDATEGLDTNGFGNVAMLSHWRLHWAYLKVAGIKVQVKDAVTEQQWCWGLWSEEINLSDLG